MCGIAGLFRPRGIAPDDTAIVERMTDALAHRGPSGSGIQCLERAVFGHRRLAIIDLSPAGQQPMTNEDRSLWVTYNGELYNHSELRSELISNGHIFRSHSDTEVLLHGYEQWGMPGLLERLRGMFAFGLYDPGAGLLLARDRLGIKPLYVHVDERGAVLFASEVRGLLASGAVRQETDIDAVAGFLLAGAMAAPKTIIKGVTALLPGHYLTFGFDRSTSDQIYWDLSSERSVLSADGARANAEERREAVSRVRVLLEDAVARHLVSDVPLGVFLSGGVDSGAVAGLATRARARAGAPPLVTLTVSFEEAEFDEAAQTRDVARAFGTDHREIRVTRREFVDALPKFFAAMDQPTNDGVNTYFVSKAARDAGLTVVLSGLGGDELFWGYKHYNWLATRGQWLTDCPSSVRRLASLAGSMWGRALGRDNWMRMEFLQSGASGREMYLLLRGFFPPRYVMDLLGIGTRELAAVVERQFEGLRPNFNYIEFKRYLHDQLLRDTDVFSMAHSIEVRVPLLDHFLVEYAHGVSARLKLANGINKPLLVEALDEPFITRAAAERKRGFSFPMNQWMKASAADLQDLALSGGILDRRVVQALWERFRAGRLHWSRAWALSALASQPQRSNTIA